MKKLLLALTIFASPLSAQQPAATIHHSLPMRVVRNEAGMVKVMAMPWKHPFEATTLWVQAGGTAFDYYETRRALSLCVGCEEGNSIFLGQHPQSWRIDLTAVGEFLLTGGITHAGWSHTRESWYGKIGWEATPGMVAGVHAWAGFIGRDQANIWAACWRDPACAARNHK